MWFWFLVNLGQAQVSNGEVPYLNAQSFRPAVDSYSFLFLNDTNMGKAGTFNYRSTFSYSDSPLVYEDMFGNQTQLLSSVTQMDVSAGFTPGKLRFALSAPVVLNAQGLNSSGQNLSEFGLGEVLADVKLQLLNRNTHRLGMAIMGRSSLPTNTTASPLGTNGWMFEVEGAMDAHFDLTTIAWNVGHRHQPEVALENLLWGSQLYSRFGLSQAFDEERGKGLATEFQIATLYSDISGGNGVSSELMLSGWWAVHEIYQLRFGVAKGLSNAITTPDWRAIVSVSFLHHSNIDSDGDGIVDHKDLCPATPEDFDQVDDEDGCPEPTVVSVNIVDQFGNEVHTATWNAGAHGGLGTGSFKTHASKVDFSIDLEGYENTEHSIDIEHGDEHQVTVQIDMILGSMRVLAVDTEGNPIDAVWSIDGLKGAALRPVGLTVPIAPGNHEIIVQADGFRQVKQVVDLQAKALQEVTIVMESLRVTKHLEILDKVYFKLDSHEIDERSHSLLDEVADVIAHHPYIELVQIEGHTDAQGNDDYNKKLSQERADEVRKYLIQQGIHPDRLRAVGFGEEQPIDSNETDEGRANNRRVVFNIVKRYGDSQNSDVQSAP